jgi:hypothetical protein
MSDLDALLNLPSEESKAFEHIRQTRTRFLDAYDARVLGGYDAAVDLRLTLDSSMLSDCASIANVVREIMNDEQHSPEESGSSLLLEPELWSRKHPAIVPYAVRGVFTNLFYHYLGSVMADVPDCYRIRCESYLIRMHRMLAAMIRQASEKGIKPRKLPAD